LNNYLGLKYPVTITPDATVICGGKIRHSAATLSETLEENYQNIEEARQLWIESMYEDGNDIPLPGSETENQYTVI
jgi:hypothetical protein